MGAETTVAGAYLAPAMVSSSPSSWSSRARPPERSILGVLTSALAFVGAATLAAIGIFQILAWRLAADARRIDLHSPPGCPRRRASAAKTGRCASSAFQELSVGGARAAEPLHLTRALRRLGGALLAAEVDPGAGAGGDAGAAAHRGLAHAIVEDLTAAVTSPKGLAVHTVLLTQSQQLPSPKQQPAPACGGHCSPPELDETIAEEDEDEVVSVPPPAPPPPPPSAPAGPSKTTLALHAARQTSETRRDVGRNMMRRGLATSARRQPSAAARRSRRDEPPRPVARAARQSSPQVSE